MRVQILKQLYRNCEHADVRERLVSKYWKWTNTIDNPNMRNKLSLCVMRDICSGFSSVNDIYEQWKVVWKGKLAGVDKYRNTCVGRIVQ